MAGDELRVELLAWSGCPSHPEALRRVTALLAELGRSEVPVELVWVETDDEAERLGFVGSPSVRVGGRELLEPPAGTPVGLTCRVYRTRAGRFSPLPDPDELREALAAAVGG